MNRFVLYDVVYRNPDSDKRETSIFTMDTFAGSSINEQWYNKYPHTVIIECRPISKES